jgi:predicted amidohydrolase YtcJ
LTCLSLIEEEVELVPRMYPICDFSENIIGFGSDWPVSSLNPLYGIEVSVTRQPIGYVGEFKPIGSAEQRLKIY